MYEIPRMDHGPRTPPLPPGHLETPMGKMLRRLFLMLLLAVASAQTALHVAPAWADDDGGGDSDGGDGSDGGDSGGGDSDGGDSDGDGGDSDGGDSGGDDGDTDDGGDYDDDQERARAGRASGTFLPLNAILSKVRRRYPGTVLKVRLKRRNGKTYYEIRILDRRDRLRTVTVPAGPRRKGNWTSRR